MTNDPNDKCVIFYHFDQIQRERKSNKNNLSLDSVAFLLRLLLTALHRLQCALLHILRSTHLVDVDVVVDVDCDVDVDVDIDVDVDDGFDGGGGCVLVVMIVVVLVVIG